MLAKGTSSSVTDVNESGTAVTRGTNLVFIFNSKNSNIAEQLKTTKKPYQRKIKKTGNRKKTSHPRKKER